MDYKKLWSEAAERIMRARERGEKPNIRDFFILGTNFDVIDKWFEAAYKDLPNDKV